MIKNILKRIYFKYKCVQVLNVNKVSIKSKLGKNAILINSVIFSNVEIGDYSYCNYAYVLSGKIGRFCSIGYGAIIGPANHPIDLWITHPIIYDSKFKKFLKSDEQIIYEDKDACIIEDNVWIGANCVILKGVTIGEGSVIAAGSVVTKDVEAYTIVAGIPAREIRKRVVPESNLFMKNKSTNNILKDIEIYIKNWKGGWR